MAAMRVVTSSGRSAVGALLAWIDALLLHTWQRLFANWLSHRALEKVLARYGGDSPEARNAYEQAQKTHAALHRGRNLSPQEEGLASALEKEGGIPLEEIWPLFESFTIRTDTDGQLVARTSTAQHALSLLAAGAIMMGMIGFMVAALVSGQPVDAWTLLRFALLETPFFLAGRAWDLVYGLPNTILRRRAAILKRHGVILD